MKPFTTLFCKFCDDSEVPKKNRAWDKQTQKQGNQTHRNNCHLPLPHKPCRHSQHRCYQTVPFQLASNQHITIGVSNWIKKSLLTGITSVDSDHQGHKYQSGTVGPPDLPSSILVLTLTIPCSTVSPTHSPSLFTKPPGDANVTRHRFVVDSQKYSDTPKRPNYQSNSVRSW